MNICLVGLLLFCYIVVSSSKEESEDTEDIQKICKANENHILCKDTGKESCTEKDNKVTEFEIMDQIEIEHMFNNMRVLIAARIYPDTGNIILRSGTQILELRWDPLLARLAAARAEDCNLNLIEDEKFQFESFTLGQMIFSPNHPDYGAELNETDGPYETIYDAISNGWAKYASKMVFKIDNVIGRKPYPEYLKALGEEDKTFAELRYSILQSWKDDHYLIGCAMSNYTETTNVPAKIEKEEVEKHSLFACFTGASNATAEDPIIFNKGTAVECPDEGKKSTVYVGLCDSSNEKKYKSGNDLIKSEETTTPPPETTVEGDGKNDDNDSSNLIPSVEVDPPPKISPISLPISKDTGDSIDDGSSSGTKKSSWIFILSSLVFVSFFKREMKNFSLIFSAE